MPDGWSTFQAATKRCSIHWRTDRFVLVERRSLLLSDGAGLDFPAHSRTGAVVVLRDLRNGQLVKVTCVHLVPHADKDNRDGVITTTPRGRLAVIPSIDTLLGDSKAHPAAVEIIAGDVNVDLDSDLRIHDNGMVERFNRGGFQTDVQALGPTPDTHGTDELDWLLLKGDAEFISHRTRPQGKSDHHAKTAGIAYAA